MSLQKENFGVEKNASLKIIGVLNNKSTVWGIPSKMFAVALVVCIFILWKAPFIVGIPLSLLIFAPLYLIHIDDPHGLVTAFDSLGRPLVYEAAASEPLQLVLIRERQAAFIFDDPRKPQIRNDL